MAIGLAKDGVKNAIGYVVFLAMVNIVNWIYNYINSAIVLSLTILAFILGIVTANREWLYNIWDAIKAKKSAGKFAKTTIYPKIITDEFTLDRELGYNIEKEIPELEFDDLVNNTMKFSIGNQSINANVEKDIQIKRPREQRKSDGGDTKSKGRLKLRIESEDLTFNHKDFEEIGLFEQVCKVIEKEMEKLYKINKSESYITGQFDYRGGLKELNGEQTHVTQEDELITFKITDVSDDISLQDDIKESLNPLGKTKDFIPYKF